MSIFALQKVNPRLFVAQSSLVMTIYPTRMLFKQLDIVPTGI